uniref:Uncharacterized protein n=1 Tax=Arundo donax TaxID=35708 RepID=A0A0A9BGZ6_ARUDO
MVPDKLLYSRLR